MASETCAGCGVALETYDGPMHPYLGASAGCWALFGEVLAREFNNPVNMRVHGTTVDTYAVQHPGVPEPRSIQSVNLHLVRLGLVLEHGVPQDAATRLMTQVKRGPELIWLEPPTPNGSVTAKDVLQQGDRHRDAVMEWARDVWDAWALHHDHVHRLMRIVNA